MDFMHPGMLFGAGAVAIPVVLHLMMRQRPRQLEFPALRFLQARQTSNRRTLKLRHILLLLLRMGALALLAFALARPSTKLLGMLGDQEGPITAVLVFDTSPRMAYQAEKKTRLAAAQQFAAELLASLPPKSQIGILDTANPARVYEADPAIARERVSQLKTGGRSGPLAATCEAAVELLREAQYPRKELYVFTDFSLGAWSGNRAGDWARRAIDGGVAKIEFVDVGAEKPVDYSLGSVTLSDQTLVRNRPLIVSTAVSSIGSGAKRLVRLSIVDPATGKLVDRGEKEVVLGDDETQEVEFPKFTLGLGTHQGEVRIDDEDSLPDNNKRYFTVNVRPAQRVLVAAPEPVEDRAVFYREAVAGRELQVIGIAPYELSYCGFSKLGEEDFSNYSAVVLLDPPALADQVWQQIEAYARGGGGVAIFLGPATVPEQFNAEIPQGVLGGRIGITANFRDNDHYLNPDPDQHPLLADFKPVKNSTPWEDFPIYHYWQLFRPESGTTLVASYNDKGAAIVERPIGLGRVVTITTPISEPTEMPDEQRWNLLTIGTNAWPFVVLANGITQYLIGRDTPVNYLAQESATVRLDPLKRFETYLVTRRNSDAAPLRLAADLKRNVLTVPITDAVGNYRVQAGGSDDGIDLGFSVNLPADGDSLRRVDPEHLNKLFADVPHETLKKFSELKRTANPDRSGRELFPILICTVAVVLGIEQVLANRFYKRGKT